MQQLRLSLLFLTSTGAFKVSSLGGNCITEHAACLKDNSFIMEFNHTNMDGCQERCVMADQCTYWTWWWGQARCQLFTTCRENEEDCVDCESGPRSCGEQPRSVSIISGGLNMESDIQTQDEVTVVSPSGICQQAAFTSNLAQMPRHRWGHVSTFLVSVFIVCGGSTEQYGGYAPNNTCDLFSLNTRQWESMEAMAEPRHQAAGIGLLGKFYMTGGVALSSSRTSVASMEVYCPYSGKWSQGPDMPRPLSGHCIVKHLDSFIVIGGTDLDMEANGVESDMIFRFNVTTNSWQTLGQLLVPRTGHGCSMNEKEEIIVTGGKSSNEPLKESEKIKFTGPNTIQTGPFTALPVKIAHHAQADTGEVQLFGGDVSNVGRNFVIEYEDTSSMWEMTNVTLPENLSYHHVTKYPAYLVKC